MNKTLDRNIRVITYQWKALREEYAFIFSRFRYVTLPFMKTRVPSAKLHEGFPDNNDVFHLLTAFIEELYDKAPRICAYVTIAGLIAWPIVVHL